MTWKELMGDFVLGAFVFIAGLLMTALVVGV